jgi:hypothetical protein
LLFKIFIILKIEIQNSTLFPKKYPEFKAKFNELCQVERDKQPIDLTMIEIDEICKSYDQIIKIFPELKEYDFRYNQNM